MAFSAFTSLEISQSKALITSLWGKIKSNFENHQSRINALDGASSFTTPGVIAPYAGASAPAGWRACDGSAISRSAYSALFEIVGTSYGPGDGSTTFNLPDFRGKTPVGSGAGSGLTTRAIGDDGGEEGHQLTTDEIPSHNHTKTDPGHTSHTYPQVATAAGGATPSRHFAGGGSGTQTTGSSSTGITIDNTGSGQAHETMQPWLCCLMVIKT